MTLCSGLSYSSPRISYHRSSPPKPITAAVHTRHSVSLKKVDLPQNKPVSPGTIEVNGAVPSFVIKFNSASSKLNLFHEHQPGKVPPVKESFSEDAPHYLKHSVRRPIHQVVRELIFPSRRIIQQINPVTEEIRTIVAKSSNQSLKQSTPSLSQPQAKMVPSLIPKLPVDNFEKTTKFRISDKVTGKNEDESEKPEPDLVLNETNMIDNSLYNGNSDIEMKYVSPNRKSSSKVTPFKDYQNEHNFLNSPPIYRDRR